MDDEIERPQECYNFQGIRDFLKKYKSRLQQNGHRHRDHHHHLNRSRSFVLPHNVKDKACLHNLKANNDKNKDSNRNGVKKIEKIGEEDELHKKHGNYGNNNNFENNYGCFRTIVLLNAPKKKQAPSRVSASDLSHHNSATIQKDEEIKIPSKTTSFESKASLGRSRSSINNSFKSQQWGRTPDNSRAPSINRTFSTGTTTTTTTTTTRANSFNKEMNNNSSTRNSKPFLVNRSTSMNIGRSRSNNNNYNDVVMTSFRSFNKSRSGHVIMFSNSSGVLKPPAMEKELECTLEELCHGSVKKIRVSRDVYSSTGQITREEEVLTVNIKPGWKAGTKITFEGTTSDCDYKADVVFIISDKPHHLFLRNNDDLEMEIEISLVDALTGCALTIPLLGGEKMSMAIQDDVVYPGFHKVIVGQGLPNQKNPLHRGDLKVKFTVEFPKSLTEDQRSNIFSIFSGVDFEG